MAVDELPLRSGVLLRQLKSTSSAGRHSADESQMQISRRQSVFSSRAFSSLSRDFWWTASCPASEMQSWARSRWNPCHLAHSELWWYVNEQGVSRVGALSLSLSCTRVCCRINSVGVSVERNEERVPQATTHALCCVLLVRPIEAGGRPKLADDPSRFSGSPLTPTLLPSRIGHQGIRTTRH